jgi:hypothetical protein
LSITRRRESLIEVVSHSTTLAATTEVVQFVKVIVFITTGEKKNAQEKN